MVKIGVVAHGEAALAANAEQARRAVARQVDEAGQRQAAGIDVIEHDGHQRLHAGHAGMAFGIGVLLLLAGVRGVVGAQDIDDA